MEIKVAVPRSTGEFFNAFTVSFCHGSGSGKISAHGDVVTPGTMREEFLSEEDLDLKNLSDDELFRYWELWLRQAQISNDLDQDHYSHGVFAL